MIEDIKPIKDDLYTPKIEGAEEEIRSMSYERRKKFMVKHCLKLLKLELKKN